MRISAATPRVSIIIPSWSGDVSCPMRSIEQQTFANYEVTVVQEPGIRGAQRFGPIYVGDTIQPLGHPP